MPAAAAPFASVSGSEVHEQCLALWTLARTRIPADEADALRRRVARDGIYLAAVYAYAAFADLLDLAPVASCRLATAAALVQLVLFETESEARGARILLLHGHPPEFLVEAAIDELAGDAPSMDASRHWPAYFTLSLPRSSPVRIVCDPKRFGDLGGMAAVFKRPAAFAEPILAEEPFFCASVGVAGAPLSGKLDQDRVLMAHNEDMCDALVAAALCGEPLRRALGMLYPRKVDGPVMENAHSVLLKRAPVIVMVLLPHVALALGWEPEHLGHLALKARSNLWRSPECPACASGGEPGDWPSQLRLYFKASFFNHACAACVHFSPPGPGQAVGLMDLSVGLPMIPEGSEATLPYTFAHAVDDFLGTPCRCAACLEPGGREAVQRESREALERIGAYLGRGAGAADADPADAADSYRRVAAAACRMSVRELAEALAPGEAEPTRENVAAAMRAAMGAWRSR